jgi:hypothetical protein
MTKGRTAEKILALAIEPGRASDVTGDLLELNANGRVWFWPAVFHALISISVVELKTRPRFYLGLAMRGSLVQSGIAIAVTCPYTLGKYFFSYPAYLDRGWFDFIGLVLWILAPLIAGCWTLRRAPGRRLAVCLALAAVSPFVLAMLNIPFVLAWSLAHGKPGFPTLWLNWWEAAFLAPYLLSAIFARGHSELTRGRFEASESDERLNDA